MSNQRSSRGDTIVEILFALLVMTTLLVGAFVATTKTQASNRAAQERSEAVKLSESQLERLRGLVRAGSLTVVNDEAFCITDDSSVVKINDPIADPFPNPFTEPLETATLPYPAACGNIASRYNVALRRDAASQTYEILIRWDRIGGNRDQINMYYRVYP